ncbi:hypothetical protein VD659_08145 [Herbiconiux sp. 11R-BC]|uniref:hypothetical protein n=1 Tax=Herbiconiux sp. 11R-BC TaxID=3111637 RepID=UPI003BFD35B9
MRAAQIGIVAVCVGGAELGVLLGRATGSTALASVAGVVGRRPLAISFSTMGRPIGGTLGARRSPQA